MDKKINKTVNSEKKRKEQKKNKVKNTKQKETNLAKTFPFEIFLPFF
jgi:hypothetical protein